MSKLGKLGVSLALSGVFLWVAFAKVDLGAMVARATAVPPLYVTGFFVCLVLMHLCRVYRWGTLVQPFAPVGRAALFRISGIGLMLMVLLPLRLGELARPYLLKRATGASLNSGLGAVAVERTLDGVVVGLMFFGCMAWLPSHYVFPGALRWAGALALLAFAGLLGGLFAALWANQWLHWAIRRTVGRMFPNLSARLEHLLASFVTGLQALPSRGHLGGFLAWTAAYWGLNGFGMWLLMRGFGWPLPPIAGFAVVSVVVIGIMIPAGPGFLGTFQAGILAGLAVFGIERTDAAAYGLVVYPLTLLVVVGLGLPFLLAGHLRQVREVLTQSRDAAAERGQMPPGNQAGAE